MANSFRDLNIWKNGFDLLIEVYKATAKFPVEEKYGLTSQIRNSANSVVANIAESHGRFYYADKVRVLYQARGEAEETRSHLSLAFGLRYMDKGTFSVLDAKYEGLSMGISSYINSLKRKN